jgi:hypothetical protein
MQNLVREYVEEHGLELWALGSASHRRIVSPTPFGLEARYIDAESHPDLVSTYLAANRQAFSGPLALPGWVLTDLYLLPGVVGIFVGSPETIETRWPAELLPDGRAILAAYYAAPSLTPGLFIGVSLLSAAAGIGAGAMIKALTLKMNNASRLRGVSRWSAPAIRAHVSVGPLQLLSRTPGPHEHEASSFVYETFVANETRLRKSLRGEHSAEIVDKVELEDQAGLDRLMKRVAEGEKLAIVGPGVDREMRVCLGRGDEE